MRLVTIINQCCKFESFVFKKAEFDEKKKSIFLTIEPRKNSKPICNQCNNIAPGYDKLAAKLVQFIPFWGFQVFFLYAMRRVQCPNCGNVAVEKVPWAAGKNHLTNIYIKYLAGWAKEMAWQIVANRFRTSWQTVHKAVQMTVEYGLKHRTIDNVVTAVEILVESGQ